MAREDPASNAWPPLPYDDWRATATTLQRWTQIVGKVRLALTPWLNHGWHVPLYVSARGLGTGLVHAHATTLEIDFDFVDHRLVVTTAVGGERGFALAPMSVATFYRRLMAELAAARVEVAIDVHPNEIADPIAFPDDETHADYDADAVARFWRALVSIDRVLRIFRTSFVGKASPVHFFWGSFDLAATRFSGRPAPLHPGGIPGLPDAVTREAYSHEVSSAGFWPGNDAYPHAALYAYAYPSPRGFATAAIEPDGAVWSEAMGEWLLPYELVRTAADREGTALRFFQSTHRAAAALGHWDPSLECAIGAPRLPRHVG